MAKILKPGRVVIVLNGKYAGKKAVIVSVFNSTKRRPFTHLLIAGVKKTPRAVNRLTANKQSLIGASRVKSFAQFINAAHVMPTRHFLAFTEAVKKAIKPEKFGALKSSKKPIIKKLNRVFRARVLARRPKAPQPPKGKVPARVMNEFKAAQGAYMASKKALVAQSFFFRKLRF